MSEPVIAVATLESASRRIVRPLSADPTVGKDILELLSSSMYVDPRAVYREYIQNAADSIDHAFALGLYEENELGRIDIVVDNDGRTIVIRDNGAGIPVCDAERVLTALGASGKRGTDARGFRGVGRLAALGYAQAVSFRTRANGESHFTEVRWDCKKLKTSLLSLEYKGDLRQLLYDAVTVTTDIDVDADEHYFEVRLERVVRIKNDVLMNKEEVERYVSEVAPTPFGTQFRHAKTIASALNSSLTQNRFHIFVNNAKQYVTRPHRSEFSVTAKKVDELKDIEIHTLRDDEGRTQAVLWIAHSSYLGALHGAPSIRGLRARVGDMQIGDEQVFAAHFSEPRFNSWIVGELHIVDRQIMPNGRRDGFEQGERLTDLVTRLAPILRKVVARCRATSAARARIRSFDRGGQRVRQLLELLARDADLSPRRRSLAKGEIVRQFVEMERIANYSGLSAGERQRMMRKLAMLRAAETGSGRWAPSRSGLSKVPAARRKLYEDVMQIVATALAPTTSPELVDRVLARIEKHATVKSSQARKRAAVRTK